MAAAVVGIVVGIYGDYEKWEDIAQTALRSAFAQVVDNDKIKLMVCPSYHETSLAEARNEGVRRMPEADYLIFLDADDTLDENYVTEMMKGTADIRRPSTLGVYPDGRTDISAVMIPEKDIRFANYIVVGALMRRRIFDNVGGFADLPILEDWDLFRRMILGEGASVEEIPDAIYRVGVNPGSRNGDQKLHAEIYAQITR